MSILFDSAISSNVNFHFALLLFLGHHAEEGTDDVEHLLSALLQNHILQFLHRVFLRTLLNFVFLQIVLVGGIGLCHSNDISS